MNRWIIPCILVGLVGLLAYGLLQPSKDPVSVLVGKPAPLFALKDHEGTTHELVQYKGKPVVINFWASWCQPCHAEAAELVKAALKHKETIQFIGILYNDSTGKHEEYIKRYGVFYPTLIDTGSRMAIQYGVGQIPDTFIIDQNGTIIFHHLGSITDSPEITARFYEALQSVEGTP